MHRMHAHEVAFTAPVPPVAFDDEQQGVALLSDVPGGVQVVNATIWSMRDIYV